MWRSTPKARAVSLLVYFPEGVTDGRWLTMVDGIGVVRILSVSLREKNLDIYAELFRDQAFGKGVRLLVSGLKPHAHCVYRPLGQCCDVIYEYLCRCRLFFLS